MKTKLSIISFFLAMAILVSCRETDKDGKPLDTPTSGTISISVDESVQPVFEQEVESFEETYKGRVKIHATYKSEAEAFNDFLKDSGFVPLIVVSRDLNENEKNWFRQKGMRIRTTKVAWNAIALVINRESPDSNLHISKINDLLSGNISTWGELWHIKNNSNLQVVFDNSGSSSLRSLQEKFGTDTFPGFFFAAKSNEEVLKFVEKNPYSIGVVGVSWVATRPEGSAGIFTNRVKVLGLSSEDSADENFYLPYAGNVVLGHYPLVSPVYLHDRQGRAGLATGFTAYVAAQQGQAIINLSPMVPATMPIRTGQFKEELKIE